MWALRFAGLAALAVLPGAWLGFTLPDRQTPRRVKWALTVAWSPAIVAFEVAVCALIGVGFEQAVLVCAALGLLSLPIVVRGHRGFGAADTESPRRDGMLAILAAVSFLGIVLFTMWATVPGLRLYGWHNMMQTAVCDQISQLPRIPQEADMAGLRLNYGWLGLVQLTAMAWLVDKPPTIVFVLVNVLQLLALVTLMYETTRELYSQRHIPNPLAVVAMLLGTNLAGTVAYLVHAPIWLQGEARIGPFIAKYLFLDSMVIGLSLVAGLVYVASQATMRVIPRISLVVPALVLAIAASYPLLIPSAACLAGALWLAVVCGRRLSAPAYRLSSVLGLTIGLVLSVGAAIGYVRWLGQGSPSSPLHATDLPYLRWNLIVGGPVIGLMVAVAWFQVARVRRVRLAPPVVLALAAAGSAGLYFTLKMPYDVQYKSLFTAALCLAPFMAGQLTCWLRQRPLYRVVVIAFLLVPVVTGIASLRTRHQPPNLGAAAPLDETSFHLRAMPGPDRDWLDALRAGTPDDTWVMTPNSVIPVSVLAQRPSLIASDSTHARSGYSMTVRSLLLDVKGYAPSEYERRAALRQRVYEGGGDYAALTRQLSAFGHPIAIVFDRRDTDYLKWLDGEASGHSVPNGSPNIVWLMPAP